MHAEYTPKSHLGSFIPLHPHPLPLSLQLSEYLSYLLPVQPPPWALTPSFFPLQGAMSGSEFQPSQPIGQLLRQAILTVMVGPSPGTLMDLVCFFHSLSHSFICSLCILSEHFNPCSMIAGRCPFYLQLCNQHLVDCLASSRHSVKKCTCG